MWQGVVCTHMPYFRRPSHNYYHYHYCSHFMAATFDFTFFFYPGFLKAALLYTTWLIFVWIPQSQP